MATQWQKLMCCKCAVLLSIVQSSVVAPQTSFLRQKISDIAAQARGTVAAACSLPGIALDCDVNSDAKAPMQSVFKLPLALAVLHKVEQGSLSLDQHVRFRPDDRILPQTGEASECKRRCAP
jgi:beta-lactamase class A